MNLGTLVSVLLSLNIRVSIQKAEALYKALGMDLMASDLEYYRTECQRLTDLNSRLTDQNESLRFPQDQDLARLRAKLMGTTHDLLVETALGSSSIIDSLASDRKIQAIKELRVLAQCGLREAKDAVEDHRVTERAAMPKWERDLFY